MILYLDTSALLKLIFVEDRDAEVREWFSSTQRAATSIITYPEACAAMSRRSRVTGPAAVAVAGTVDQWVALLNHYMDQIICLAVAGRPAGHLALAHGLRGMDAIHLATAVDLRERLAARDWPNGSRSPVSTAGCSRPPSAKGSRRSAASSGSRANRLARSEGRYI